MKLNSKNFNELTTTELYQILQLRFNVFVLEQQSLYDEFDNKDFEAQHIFFSEDSKIVSYIRVFKKDSNTGTFGRVVVTKEYRGKNLGYEIVQEGIKYLLEDLASKSIDIEAQQYLKKFYEKVGFVQVSDPYDDCGVMHIDMTLSISD
jgi:ElaA protein